jgi:hypothetical protein
MSWSFWLILFPTLCYLGTAVAYGIQRDWPSVVIFTGYSLANCGFLAIELVKARA